MSLHFLVAIGGALVAAAGTGVLVTRCLRAPNAALVAWTVAIFGLTVALGAQALGYYASFGPIAFRAMEIGAQVLAPLALVFGLSELAGKSVASRFAARLLLIAVAVVALVILATDPLGSAAFTKAWPAPTVYYQIVPNKLLEYVLPPVTVIVALIAMGVTAARPGRDPAWRDAVPAAAAAGVAALVLAVPGVIALLKLSLPVASLFTPACIIAAGLTWFAGAKVGGLRLEVLRHDAGGEGERRLQRSWADGPDAAGDFGPVAADDEFGIYRSNGSHGSDRPGDKDLDYRGAASHGDYGDDSGYLDQVGYQREAGYRDEPGYPDQPGYRGEAGYRQQAGYPDAAGPAATGREPRAHLFGQIAIYTLLEDRVQDFDRLTRQVIKQVRSQEPDTLVYIVHAVPSAPMQRILYEVYSDRTAYEAHKRQPYVIAFEADRRPYVLATNIIELGLQQAKVSPLPSVSDLLTDTGFDLLNDTGFGQPGYGPRASGSGPPAGGTSGGGPVGGGPVGGGPVGGGPVGGGPGPRRLR